MSRKNGSVKDKPQMYELFNKVNKSITWQSKMFKTDLRKKSHEIRPIKSGRDMWYSLYRVQQENLEEYLMKSGRSKMVLIPSIHGKQLLKKLFK